MFVSRPEVGVGATAARAKSGERNFICLVCFAMPLEINVHVEQAKKVVNLALPLAIAFACHL